MLNLASRGDEMAIRAWDVIGHFLGVAREKGPGSNQNPVRNTPVGSIDPHPSTTKSILIAPSLWKTSHNAKAIPFSLFWFLCSETVEAQRGAESHGSGTVRRTTDGKKHSSSRHMREVP